MSTPRSHTHSLRAKATLKLDACASERSGCSTTSTTTVPDLFAPDSSGPSQCSGTSLITRTKPAPARASAAADSPATSGAGARTTVSAPSSGEKGSSAFGSKPPASTTSACAKSCVARASSASASVSLPHVPGPVSSDNLPCGMPPMPVRRSSGVALCQGRGGGTSAALVSAWLPKRRRIELIADSSATSCILLGASGERRREIGRGEDHYTEQMFEREEPSLFLICAGLAQPPAPRIV